MLASLTILIIVFVVIVVGIDCLKVHEIVRAALTELFYIFLSVIFVVYRHYVFESALAFIRVLIASRLIYFTSRSSRSKFLLASKCSITI